jgi:SAM-dependent methyltransferase
VSQSLPVSYFDGLYERSPDPWSFETSAYEQEKFQATLAALPRPRYRRALEIGCSIGVLTRQLADRCDELVALEPAAKALERARERCRDLPHVAFLRSRVPADWPDSTFDLILLSEVVYYLDAADVGRLAEKVMTTIRPGGHVELVHWTGETDYPLSGDEAADIFIHATAGRLNIIARQRAPEYRLDLLAAR